MKFDAKALTNVVLAVAIIAAAFIVRTPSSPDTVPVAPQAETYLQAADRLVTDKTDRAIFSAIYAQLAASLETDGKQDKPVVTTTMKMQDLLMSAQLYRKGLLDPEKFSEYSAVMGTALGKSLGDSPGDIEMTKERRVSAQGFFSELAVVLE